MCVGFFKVHIVREYFDMYLNSIIIFIDVLNSFGLTGVWFGVPVKHVLRVFTITNYELITGQNHFSDRTLA